jgi:hypothetical protein
MKILVSGSLRGVDAAATTELKDAARELGKAIAEGGHTLLVGSDDPDDVDPYVVDGFTTANGNGKVEVHLQKNAKKCYAGKANVENCWHRYNDWDVTVLEVVRSEAEAVVVVAGLKGVIQAGIAGWMLGRPTIPFAGFGGGAASVWDYGSSDRQRFYFGALTDLEIDQLSSPWEPDVTGARIVKHIGRCAENVRREAVPARVRLTVTTGVLIALMLWVTFLALPLLGVPRPPLEAAKAASVGAGVVAQTAAFDASNGIRFLLLLAAVCSAGAFGALVQSMRGIRNDEVVSNQRVLVDVVLGVSAGFLTATLYLLAQIAITGKLEIPPDNPNYSRVAVIVSMAAVFASLYLDTAFSRFDELKESVISGAYGKKPVSS